MRSRLALVLIAAVLLSMGSAHTLRAEEAEKAGGADYFTLSGGWSWPVGGAVEESYESGLTVGASFRKSVAASYMSGIEFGYTWYSLNGGNLANVNPGSTFSGGDMGLLSITTENDYLFGAEANPMRPFLNLGIGYYKSFVDEATETTGSSSAAYPTGVHDSSFFGFHAGIGALINREKFGLRVDTSYQHLFAGGPDLEFFSARAGIVFNLGAE